MSVRSVKIGNWKMFGEEGRHTLFVVGNVGNSNIHGCGTYRRSSRAINRW